MQHAITTWIAFRALLTFPGICWYSSIGCWKSVTLCSGPLNTCHVSGPLIISRFHFCFQREETHYCVTVNMTSRRKNMCTSNPLAVGTATETCRMDVSFGHHGYAGIRPQSKRKKVLLTSSVWIKERPVWARACVHVCVHARILSMQLKCFPEVWTFDLEMVCCGFGC